jgi:hypothetical protein
VNGSDSRHEGNQNLDFGSKFCNEKAVRTPEENSIKIILKEMAFEGVK